MLQYIPRIRSIFPITRQIVKTSGSLAQTSWAGAAYNLVLYVLASHVRKYISIVYTYVKSRNFSIEKVGILFEIDVSSGSWSSMVSVFC